MAGFTTADPAALGDMPTIGAGRAYRFLSLVFLGFVGAYLVLPLAQTVYPLLRTIVPPVEERRTPSPFPSPRLLLDASGDFSAALNNWFDDRVGFRDLFIRTKNQIDYSLFGTSRKVYVGAQGWLFDHGNPDPVAGLDAAGLAALERSFLTLAERLHDKGVRLIVVGYPDKSRVYPEMAPPQLPLRPPDGNYDKFRQFLASQSALTFIDAETIIKREKSRTQDHLYALTDLHTTQAGQLPVVKEIIAQIARAEGRDDIVWSENFRLTHQTLAAGNESRFLSLLVPVMETNFPHFDGSYTIGGTEQDGEWNIPDRRVLERDDNGIGRPFDWAFHLRPELCPQRLPGMVLFGNSFSDAYWALGLHRYFCFIQRTKEPISRFKLLFDTMPPNTKYFIYQYYLPILTRDAPPLE